MMTVTTEVLEKKFAKIQGDIVAVVNATAPYSETEQEYLMLVNKIFINLQSASTLASRGAWGDAKILIRSAFETFILLKIFEHYPERHLEWKEECSLISFRNSFILNRNYPQELSDINLISHYESLSSRLKSKYPLEQGLMGKIMYLKKEKLGKKLENFRSKFTNMRTLINDIEALDSKFEGYQRFRFSLYDENSQIAHGDLHQIIKFYVDFKSQNTIKHLHDFCRQYALMIIPTMQALTVILKRDFGNIYDPFLQDLVDLMSSVGLFKNNQTPINSKSPITQVRIDTSELLRQMLYNNK